MAVRGTTTGATGSLAPISSNIVHFNRGGCPEGVEPRAWRKALKARVEQHLGVVGALLRLLDDMDGDCDLEDTADDEPSLGGYAFRGEHDLELDDADREPTLGWSNHENQAFIATENTYRSDLEGEDCDREYSAGVDCSEAQMTEWSPEHPVQIVQGPGL